MRSGSSGQRQRQLRAGLTPQEAPAGGATGAAAAAGAGEAPQFRWDFFENAQKVTPDVRYTADVAAAGAAWLAA